MNIYSKMKREKKSPISRIQTQRGNTICMHANYILLRRGRKMYVRWLENMGACDFLSFDFILRNNNASAF